jgi:hypothetical protein
MARVTCGGRGLRRTRQSCTPRPSMRLRPSSYAITPEQLKEAEAVAAGRAKLESEYGAKLPTDAHKNVELRAAQAGMTLLYDGVYRYMSNVGVHPSDTAGRRTWISKVLGADGFKGRCG